MDMNWDAIGAIGELTGALAVVVSVIYLALQIRNNTQATMVTVVQDTIDEFANLDRLVASTPDLAHIILRGRASISNLSAEELLRFECYYSMMFQVLEGWYTGSARARKISKEQVEVTETILRNHFRNAGVRESWARTKDEYPKGFASWVDEKSPSGDSVDIG
jgi:hypothetical protein